MNKTKLQTGYVHPGYAESLAEFGTPIQLPGSRGWVLERRIPGESDLDAMGCYPLFFCSDWLKLHNDLDKFANKWVSLVVVTDPFANVDPEYLKKSFKDLAVPFKQHFVVDLKRPLNEIIGRRHRKNGRRALRKIEIDVCPEPALFIEEWIQLYSHLIRRHNIAGIPAFSAGSFWKQLKIPNSLVLRAIYNDQTVGAQIYFCQGEVVYCHLGASSPVGYELGAFYALDYFSIEYFSDKAHWLDLGGSAGTSSTGVDGLSLYKKGWATNTRTTYLCGRIFKKQKYTELAKHKGSNDADYFPAYRRGEFG